MNLVFAVARLSAVLLLLLQVPVGANAEEMTFRLVSNGGNCNGCEWIAADGEITKDTPAKLAVLMAKSRYGTVIFNSPGGNLAASIQMGRSIRAAGYSTGVGKTVNDEFGHQTTQGGICASACAFAFLGGTARYAEKGKIGVHQFYNNEAIARPDDQLFTAVDLSVNQYIEALLMEYAIQMGVDYRVVLTAAATPPDDMHFLTESELQDWKVTFDPDAFEPWEIEAWKSGVVAFTRSSDGRKTATVFCSDPSHPKLSITATGTNYHGPFKPVDAYTSAVDALGVTAPASQISMSETSGEYKLVIGLDGLNLEKLKTADKIYVSAFNYAPHATMSYFDFGLSDKGAYKSIRIALRNCI